MATEIRGTVSVDERQLDLELRDDDAIAEALRHEAIGRYFSFAHLPPALAARSRHFAWLAARIVLSTPASAERTVALRKLLEAKDAAVRAALPG